MYYGILIVIVVNALALTLPISIRVAFLLADWLDEKVEQYQRKN